MLLLFSTLYKPQPTQTRTKNWLINLLLTQPTTGKQSYAWWLNFFQTTVRDNWDKM